MKQDEMKKAAAFAALNYVKTGSIIGVGTGSTANHFINALATIKDDLKGAVSSSIASTERLQALGITVYDCNEVDSLDVYIDGADEVNQHYHAIKGGGGALTREKIVCALAKQFICIIDESKQVDILGQFPLPIEVIASARSYVARQLVKLGGSPMYRVGFVTDNGNIILDVYDLKIFNPIEMENKINSIAGVVTVGLFANRSADTIICGSADGVKIFHKKS